MFTLNDLWSKTNVIECQTCLTSDTTENLGLELSFERNIDDDLYDVWDAAVSCCSDPLLEGVILRDEALFGIEEIDDQYEFVDLSDGVTRWKYHMGEDFLAMLSEVDLLDD